MRVPISGPFQALFANPKPTTSSLTMSSIQVEYANHRDGCNVRTVSYDSYESAVEAVVSHFASRVKVHPNEEFDVCVSGTHRFFYDEEMKIKETELTKVLHEQKESITIGGKTCFVYLTLDGSTPYGTPYLQTIKLSIPSLVETMRDASRAERLRDNGSYHHCGNPDCDYDCGMLWCGCIDVCRGRCGCEMSDDDEYY
jgi:hypothetical protein